MNTVKKLLKSRGIHPSKRLGQNFLIDETATRKIMRAASLKPEDIVLEIGPGVGNLTQRLAQKAKKVVAVEKDPRMVKILKEVLKDFKNIEIIRGDILKISNLQFLARSLLATAIPVAFGDLGTIPNYKVVANLPFYLTAPVIRKFLESKYPPKEMVLVVQKEVAQRIAACPPKMNLLAVSVQLTAKPKVIDYISKKSFWPQPEVDSVIIKITPKEMSTISTIVKNVDREDFKRKLFKIIRAGFSQPRKQLINNFSKQLKIGKKEVENWLLKNKILPTQRAETLTIKDWIKLTKSFKIKTQSQF